MKPLTRFLTVATTLFLCLVGTEACRRPLHLPCPDSPLTATFTPTLTATNPVSYASPTVTHTATIAVTITLTSTPTSSPTSAPTSIVTPYVSPSSTSTPTRTATDVPTDTPTVAATNTETATTTSTPLCLYISSPTTILAGTYHYSCVEFKNPGWIYIDGEGVTLNVDNYYTSSGSCSIYGMASTFYLGSPASWGTNNAGAGHGGAGGADGRGNAGGSAYDSATNPVYPGSMSGSGQCSGNYFNGGAVFCVKVLNGPATLSGGIMMNGTSQPNCYNNTSTGSGSGGTINIQADTLVGSYVQLSADGGYGFSSSTSSTYNAGGGGGGIILLSYHTANNLTSLYTSVTGGAATAPALSGSDGFFNVTTY